MSSTIRLWVYACFFLSGLDALIYEVCWLNRIQLVMGHTVYSLATTLAAYMSGLGLGALYVPKLKRKFKGNTFSLYLIIELLIGIYGLAFYPLLKFLQIPYDVLVTQFHFSLLTLSLIQFVLCAILIIIPTFLMGTTLPLIAPYIYPEKSEVSEKVAILYGVNTFGAMTGSFLAGYIILPSLGYSKTIQLAAGINIGLYFLVNLFANSSQKMTHEKEESKEKRTRLPLDYWSLAALFISGFVSMLVQVIWGRLASLGFGPSTYIFPLITTIVLGGIVLGSWLWRRLCVNIETAKRMFILLPVLAAGALLFGTTAFSQAPHYVLLWNQKISPGFWLRVLFEFSWGIVCLLPAAVFTGALFPAAASQLTRGQSSDQAERSLGVGYALNIAGLITGAIIGSFLLLPYLGIELMTQGLCFILFTLATALAIGLGRNYQVAVASWVLGWIALSISPNFDWTLLTAGHFYNRDQKISSESLQQLGWIDPVPFFKSRKSKLVVKRDDPHATISIHEGMLDKNYRSFKINGKIDGTNSIDLRTTRLLSAFPALVKVDAESTLIIGLGTGSTAAQALRYPQMKSVKIIELSSAMIEFSQRYFSKVDGSIWDDPRFSIEQRDGRDYLEHSKEQSDLIILEPSNPWVDGIGSLFTKEFYEIVAKRLTPTGVASIWFHSYGLDCESVQSVLGAAAQAFSSVLVFKQSGDLFLLASNRPQGLSLKPIPDSAAQIRQLLFDENNLTYKEGDAGVYRTLLEKTLIYDREDILKLSTIAPTNLDDNQFLQYRSGRTYSTEFDCQDYIGGASRELFERYAYSLRF